VAFRADACNAWDHTRFKAGASNDVINTNAGSVGAVTAAFDPRGSIGASPVFEKPPPLALLDGHGPLALSRESKFQTVPTHFAFHIPPLAPRADFYLSLRFQKCCSDHDSPRKNSLTSSVIVKYNTI